MTNNNYILGSLASDLKRVVVGLQRGSFGMADRFAKEALHRKQEVDIGKLKPYMRDILNNLEFLLRGKKESKKESENILMYSTLIQNYTQLDRFR